MPTRSIERRLAPTVCRACKLRKKTCDKTLPSCGYCTDHQLRCEYDFSTDGTRKRRRYNPGKHFVPIQSSPSSQLDASPRRLFDDNQQDSVSSLGQELDLFSSPVDDRINHVVEESLRLSKLSRNNVVDQYFQNFHSWFPMISPVSFRRDAELYETKGILRPADFNSLFLSMLLVVLPTLSPSARPSEADMRRIYGACKYVLSQVQSSTGASLRIVQATLLIAFREYTLIRPEAAYISITTCFGLVRILGITLPSAEVVDPLSPCDTDGSYQSENRIVALAIVMLERLILCEIDHKTLPPQVTYPSTDITQASGWYSASLTSLDMETSAQFRRQAQAVSLLDQLLSVSRDASNTKDHKLSKLMKLDGQVQNFLGVIMAELADGHALIYVPVALCIRILLLLHTSALDMLDGVETNDGRQKQNISLMGLDMACKMMIDVAQRHQELNAQIMPITCFYNIRAARLHLQERSKLVSAENSPQNVDTLLDAERKYLRTWTF